jgi:hypothetical protein
MKIPAIKKIVELYTLDQLDEAELAIINETAPEIDIEGDDEGEQLTHIFAAKWIIEEMENANCDFKTALRSYTEKVRNSIN